MILLCVLITQYYPHDAKAATFLLISPSPRATGMGYVNTAIADDATANFFNAAGLAFIDCPEIFVSHRAVVKEPGRYNPFVYYGVVYPLGKGSLGHDLTYLDLDERYVIDSEGNILGTIPIWRLAVKFNYARRLLDNLALGIGLKYIQQKSQVGWWRWSQFILEYDDSGTGSALALDLNFLYKILPQFTTALVIHNLGPNFKSEDGIEWLSWDQHPSNPLPRLLRFGVVVTPLNSKELKILVATDITKILLNILEEDRDFWYEIKETQKGIGTYITFYEIFSIRGGYYYDLPNNLDGLTFGAGLSIKNFKIDYALEDNSLVRHESVFSKHSFSLGYQF